MKWIERFHSQNLWTYAYMTQLMVIIRLSLINLGNMVIFIQPQCLAKHLRFHYQSKLNTSMAMRYLLLFLVIYFSINLVDSDIDGVENPLYSVVKSIFVFLTFLLLNAIDSSSIIITLVLFTLLILTSKYYSYFKNLTHNPDETILTLLNVIQIILAFSIIVLLAISTLFRQSKKRFTDYFLLRKCERLELKCK